MTPLAQPPFRFDDTNSITWTQHAIGQGGFHTGQLIDNDGTYFTWIFDCGAKSGRNFDSYLRQWTMRQCESVDWLFISHFDFDHVSGLETLMSRCVVRKVMVPYVNEEELVYVLLEEIARENLDRAFVALIADPAHFFLSRGAGRVTFLGGRRPGEPYVREDFEPDEPIGGLDDRGLTERFDKQIKALRVPRWASSSSCGVPSVGTIDGGTCAITIARGAVGLRLKPYRAPITEPEHQQLLVDARALVGMDQTRPLGRPGLGRLAYAIAELARSAVGRAKIRNLYKSHVGSSNRASLSLLSEPVYSNAADAYWHVSQVSSLYSAYGHCAWMNTGDAELLRDSDVADWQNCYSSDLPAVRVLALPHHGSDKNSDGNLQDLCPSAVLTTHAKSTSKKHPGPRVSLAAGKRLACVSEDSATAVLMRFWCR